MSKKIELKLLLEDKELLEKVLSAGYIEHKFAVRIQSLLNVSKGKAINDTAEFLGIHINSITRFVKEYNARGVDALLRNKSKKPGRAPIEEELKNKICACACHEKPEGESRWTSRSLAMKFGISHNKVAEILKERNIQPHVSSYYSFSSDPEFEPKLRDVAGLYMNPPENSIVLCVDEKTQIQAIDHRQALLFPRANLPPSQSHDYLRHGTTTLFSALDVLNGQVIGDCKDKHTTEDYLKFLKKIDRECEKGKVLHIVTDNYSTHKAKAVKDYMALHPNRFVQHFTPTHSSWLNLVERWFAELTNKKLRGENWNSVAELVRAIKDYIKYWNESKRKFQWSKTPDKILENIQNRRNAYSL